MSDDSLFALRYERHTDKPAVPQGVHELSLIVLAKGESVDLPDRLAVSTGFGPDEEVHGFGLSAFASLVFNDSGPSNTCSIDQECILPKLSTVGVNVVFCSQDSSRGRNLPVRLMNSR
jgi:hypothetical protein